jgi:hypothetical protein
MAGRTRYLTFLFDLLTAQTPGNSWIEEENEIQTPTPACRRELHKRRLFAE